MAEMQASATDLPQQHLCVAHTDQSCMPAFLLMLDRRVWDAELLQLLHL